MSYTHNKTLLSNLFLRVRSANWMLRAYGRAIARSLTGRQRNGFARLSAILLSLTFFHFFPFLVITSYMSWEGFFSYDMLKEGTSGVTAFYWWAEVFLIVGSAYIAGCLYFVIESKVKHNRWVPVRSFLFWIILAVNVIFILMIVLIPTKAIRGDFTRDHVTWLCFIAAWVVIHIGIVFNGAGRAALVSLAFGAAGLTTIAVIHPGTLALPYSLSLQFFGNGGGLTATVKLANCNTTIEGELILASPEHLYIYPRGEPSLMVISRRDVEQLLIQNLAGFGHGKSNTSRTPPSRSSAS